MSDREFSVLYVEDDYDTREAVLYLLQKRFTRVYTAADGLRGYAMFIERSPDIVITDILLPALNGLAMANRMLSANPRAAVIITSAHNEPAMKLKARELGIRHYIDKPFSLEELEYALIQCLERLGWAEKGACQPMATTTITEES